MLHMVGLCVCASVNPRRACGNNIRKLKNKIVIKIVYTWYHNAYDETDI